MERLRRTAIWKMKKSPSSARRPRTQPRKANEAGMKRLAIIASVTLLWACSSQEGDVHAWMNQEAATMKVGVKPLPEMQVFPAVEYEAAGLVQPFDASRLAVDKKAGKSNGPDVNRRREPLRSEEHTSELQ